MQLYTIALVPIITPLPPESRFQIVCVCACTKRNTIKET